MQFTGLMDRGVALHFGLWQKWRNRWMLARMEFNFGMGLAKEIKPIC